MAKAIASKATDKIEKAKQQEIEKVITELNKLGVKVSTGSVEVSNKPTINSTH